MQWYYLSFIYVHTLISNFSLTPLHGTSSDCFASLAKHPVVAQDLKSLKQSTVHGLYIDALSAAQLCSPDQIRRTLQNSYT